MLRIISLEQSRWRERIPSHTSQFRRRASHSIRPRCCGPLMHPCPLQEILLVRIWLTAAWKPWSNHAFCWDHNDHFSFPQSNWPKSTSNIFLTRRYVKKNAEYSVESVYWISERKAKWQTRSMWESPGCWSWLQSRGCPKDQKCTNKESVFAFFKLHVNLYKYAPSKLLPSNIDISDLMGG